MKYFDELSRSMEMLARDPRTMFLGQAVACAGTAMSNTLKNVSKDKLLEMPVTMQEMEEGMMNRRKSPSQGLHPHPPPRLPSPLLLLPPRHPSSMLLRMPPSPLLVA